jgi:formate-dependent nitrite reductase membrane component NrfD
MPPWEQAMLPVLTVAVSTAALFLAVLLVLLEEMRRPRVATAADVERFPGIRVLAVQRLYPAVQQRRRLADQTLPKWLNPGSDDSRVLA